jgi:hypothetical protein
VIPAHPALTPDGRFDERRQRASRYYVAAVPVAGRRRAHTQFAIRRPDVGLFAPVLTLARRNSIGPMRAQAPLVTSAACWRHRAGLRRSRPAHVTATTRGSSASPLAGATDDVLVAHCETVAARIPMMGFYLQPGVGGRLLSGRFWRRFAGLPEVVAIKVAPFNRYQTLDVVRAVAEAGRARDIALYTGRRPHRGGS